MKSLPGLPGLRFLILGRRGCAARPRELTFLRADEPRPAGVVRDRGCRGGGHFSGAAAADLFVSVYPPVPLTRRSRRNGSGDGDRGRGTVLGA